MEVGLEAQMFGSQSAAKSTVLILVLVEVGLEGLADKMLGFE